MYMRLCAECRIKTKKRWNLWSKHIFVMLWRPLLLKLNIVNLEVTLNNANHLNFRLENDLVENESVDGKL